MEPFIIEATKSSPKVVMDFAMGLIEIRGESYPENAAKFFEPIIAKLDELLNDHNTSSWRVIFELHYFNSSSSKFLLDFFERLEDASQGGRAIQVQWLYDPEDETIQECGEEFQEDAPGLDFSLIPKG